MERARDERLQKLLDEGVKLYSISKLNTMDQCPYQAYLNYVEHEPQKNNIWAICGSAIHDALQECVDEQLQDTSIVAEAVQEELENADIQGIAFPKDRNGMDSIRENWIANMTRFAKEFKTPKGKFETEQLCIYRINDKAAMHGYIDLIKYNKDKSLWILDWKTSSNFDKNHLKSAGRQLAFYALAKQQEGFEVKKVSWVMLKYCVTKWKLKNDKIKEKVSEWRNYIKDLRSVIEKKLVDAGYDELDIDVYIHEALDQNSMAPLPDEVKELFTTSIYVRDYELTDEVIEETKEYINKMISEFETRGEDEKNFPPCNVSKDSFFCASLCGYGKEKCKYYQDYCAQFVKEDDDIDLFD